MIELSKLLKRTEEIQPERILYKIKVDGFPVKVLVANQEEALEKIRKIFAEKPPRVIEFT